MLNHADQGSRLKPPSANLAMDAGMAMVIIGTDHRFGLLQKGREVELHIALLQTEILVEKKPPGSIGEKILLC